MTCHNPHAPGGYTGGTLTEGWSVEQRISHGAVTQGTLRYIYWPPTGFTHRKSSFESRKAVAEAMGLLGKPSSSEHPASQAAEPVAGLLPAYALVHCMLAAMHAEGRR